MSQLQLLVLNGSTKEHSSNQKLVAFIEKRSAAIRQNEHLKFPALCWEVFPIGSLPYFNPGLDKTPTGGFAEDPPKQISKFPAAVGELRQKIADADGILICTPEYVFSLPGVLKNALEWLVSTTVLTNKPMALVTAAACGSKAKESLELIISTLGGKFTEATSIRIQGIAGKFNSSGELTDTRTIKLLENLLHSWTALIEDNVIS